MLGFRMMQADRNISTRPYLLRAIYEWCVDNGLTPYVVALVDDSVKVPREHVKNHEIVLNIGMDATSQLRIGNDDLKFKARFGGTARDIVIPIDHVTAIYARENGQGMAFTQPPLGLHAVATDAEADASAQQEEVDSAPPATKNSRAPRLASSNAKPTTKVLALETGQSDWLTPTAPSGGAKSKPGRPSLTRIK